MKLATPDPGLYFQAERAPQEPAPLRTDVAAFVGHTQRGPVDRVVRVEGWRAYLETFGGLQGAGHTAYAVRGYFENGGQIAHILRLAGAQPQPAAAQWPGSGQPPLPGGGRFRYASYRVRAASPGNWANDAQVRLDYLRQGFAGQPELTLTLTTRAERTLVLRGLDPSNPERFEQRLEAQAAPIRLEPLGPPVALPPNPAGPSRLSWQLSLAGGSEQDPNLEAYQAAVTALVQVPEVALLALPDLYRHLPEDERHALLQATLRGAEDQHDRLVLLDGPEQRLDGTALLEWTERLRAQFEPQSLRAAALYHPWLAVPDPVGGAAQPLRLVPPCGHVAGLIARLDRERGAHHTPANAPLLEAVDLSAGYRTTSRAALNEAGVNLLRCFPGRGLMVWGGRTLDLSPQHRFVAHRRLIHRLLRSAHAVAQPLVFENNGPELWLTLVRAFTTVLLQAWRAGALKGARPDEAFRVVCDEALNPSEERDLGRVFCHIALAPAAPMEFILLRIAMGREGQLEVFET